MLTQVYAGFNQPLGLKQAPGDAARVFVQERPGRIRVFPKAAPASITTFLDLSSRVSTAGEGGLLGVAFHPEWPARPEVYVSYTESGPFRSVIARYRSVDGGLTLDAANEERLLVLRQPYDNHNGGYLEFGPDGFLYIGFGDGGSGGDPGNRGQRLNTLHGKFLRIDVDVPAAQRYAIPATNPWAQDVACNLERDDDSFPDAGARCAEIYATGFRNPWRWSFDSVSGELWAADVGQGAWEEVDLVVRGGNYGWKTREGAHCYSPSTNCSTAGLIDPVVEYGRGEGSSITGGHVYRGAAMPWLVGRFVFGDYNSGTIWAVESDGQGGYVKRTLAQSGGSLGSFGQVDGELYALSLANGLAFRLDPADGGTVDTFPQRLSETGCFTDAGEPLPALVPYHLNAPLWSDGADKARFFAIPEGTTLSVDAEGDLDFPNGAVLVKTFLLGGQKVETRLFMRHAGGEWAGYTYEWNDAGTDAQLLAGPKTKQVGGQSWFFPSRAQCLQCHTAVAGHALGPELAQLNRHGQLENLSDVGFFAAPLPSPLPSLAEPSGTAPLEARARAYLHSNCANCHQPGGPGRGPADLRFWLPLEDANVCDVAPTTGDLGLTDARLVAPGAPGRSVVSRRMHALDASRMPPVASALVDEAGAALVDAWITSLTTCP